MYVKFFTFVTIRKKLSLLADKTPKQLIQSLKGVEEVIRKRVKNDIKFFFF